MQPSGYMFWVKVYYFPLNSAKTIEIKRKPKSFFLDVEQMQNQIYQCTVRQGIEQNQERTKSKNKHWT